MNNRLRFRAWDKEPEYEDAPRMIYDIQDVDNNCTIAVPWITFGAVCEDGRFVLMQCTGLKDKNGKLIYEGDILSYEAMVHDGVEDIGGWDMKTMKGQVSWDSERASFTIPYGENFAQYNCDRFEVIGNIYENPELLKEEL